jgi:hypothetical protein
MNAPHEHVWVNIDNENIPGVYQCYTCGESKDEAVTREAVPPPAREGE